MKEKLCKVSQLMICLILLLVLVACQDQTPTPAVVIEAGHPPELVFEERIILDAVISSMDVRGAIEYKWSATAGILSKNDTPSVEFIAPNEAGEVAVTVEVIIGEINLTGRKRFQVVPPATLTETPTESSTESSTATPTKTPTNIPVPLTATSVPLTDTPPTDMPVPPTDTPLPLTEPTCKGSISQELTEQMWEAYDQGNYEKALVCTNELEQRWTLEAREQQVEKAQSDCDYTPDPNNQTEVEKFWADYWALNDVAIGWFVRGEILREQGHCIEARAAYMVVIDEYSCAYAWDPDGPWFWKIAEDAQNGYSRECP